MECHNRKPDSASLAKPVPPAQLLVRRDLLMLLGMTALGCTTTSGQTNTPAPDRDPRRVRAPQFELPDLNGRRVRLSDLREQVVLIDFWATFCAPCMVAMPHLVELARRHRAEGFQVLGISIDGPESVAQVRGVVTRYEIPFPILLDQESRIVSQYNPRVSAPFSVLVDRRGGIAQRWEGYSSGGAGALATRVKEIIDEPA